MKEASLQKRQCNCTVKGVDQTIPKVKSQVNLLVGQVTQQRQNNKQTGQDLTCNFEHCFFLISAYKPMLSNAKAFRGIHQTASCTIPIDQSESLSCLFADESQAKKRVSHQSNQISKRHASPVDFNAVLHAPC
jgi:hypothetical protein